jgi:hypothetical protein
MTLATTWVLIVIVGSYNGQSAVPMAGLEACSRAAKAIKDDRHAPWGQDPFCINPATGEVWRP